MLNRIVYLGIGFVSGVIASYLVRKTKQKPHPPQQKASAHAVHSATQEGKEADTAQTVYECQEENYFMEDYPEMPDYDSPMT